MKKLNESINIAQSQVKHIKKQTKRPTDAQNIMDKGISKLIKIAAGLVTIGIYAMIIGVGGVFVNYALGIFLPYDQYPGYHWWDFILSMPLFSQIFIWLIISAAGFIFIAFLMWATHKTYHKLVGR